mmetsp:Transcript_21213/g.56678  ORF Transcript_21213/g.56678 Transcript_21213/m.56678 type:complete len:244 (-) Transcript_21213:687-1418(-)
MVVPPWMVAPAWTREILSFNVSSRSGAATLQRRLHAGLWVGQSRTWQSLPQYCTTRHLAHFDSFTPVTGSSESSCRWHPAHWTLALRFCSSFWDCASIGPANWLSSSWVRSLSAIRFAMYRGLHRDLSIGSVGIRGVYRLPKGASFFRTSIGAGTLYIDAAIMMNVANAWTISPRPTFIPLTLTALPRSEGSWIDSDPSPRSAHAQYSPLSRIQATPVCGLPIRPPYSSWGPRVRRNGPGPFR